MSLINNIILISLEPSSWRGRVPAEILVYMLRRASALGYEIWSFFKVFYKKILGFCLYFYVYHLYFCFRELPCINRLLFEVVKLPTSDVGAPTSYGWYYFIRPQAHESHFGGILYRSEGRPINIVYESTIRNEVWCLRIYTVVFPPTPFTTHGKSYLNDFSHHVCKYT